jgi:hypothetical protein
MSIRLRLAGAAVLVSLSAGCGSLPKKKSSKDQAPAPKPVPTATRTDNKPVTTTAATPPKEIELTGKTYSFQTTCTPFGAAAPVNCKGFVTFSTKDQGTYLTVGADMVTTVQYSRTGDKVVLTDKSATAREITSFTVSSDGSYLSSSTNQKWVLENGAAAHSTLVGLSFTLGQGCNPVQSSAQQAPTSCAGLLKFSDATTASLYTLRDGITRMMSYTVSGTQVTLTDKTYGGGTLKLTLASNQSTLTDSQGTVWTLKK